MANSERTINLQTENGWAILPSSLKHPNRSPRFYQYFLADLAGDVGAQHLIVNEAGDRVNPGLLGDDRPDLLEALYAREQSWLASRQ
jgi:hypothetical protein